MSGPLAKVNSVAAVNRLRAALIEFIDEASSAVSTLEMETNRVVQWVDVDRKDYWTHQAQSGGDRVSEARVSLERKRIVAVGGQSPSCQEEKQTLDAARRRLQLAEEKIQAVRHWGRVVDQEVLEFQGIVNQLSDFILVELPKAVAALGRMNTSLDSYLRVEAPVDLAAKFPLPMGESVAAPTAAGTAESAAAGTAPPAAGAPAEDDAATRAAAEDEAEAAEYEAAKTDAAPVPTPKEKLA